MDYGTSSLPQGYSIIFLSVIWVWPFSGSGHEIIKENGNSKGEIRGVSEIIIIKEKHLLTQCAQIEFSDRWA